MNDVSYEEHVEMENQLFESRLKKDKNFPAWLVAFIITLATFGVLGAFMLLVAASVR